MKINIALSLTNKKMGFTLVELVAVIVILGILSVTILPKFAMLTSNAQQNVGKYTAGALTTAISNYHLTWIMRGQKSSVTVEGNTVNSLSCGSGQYSGYPDPGIGAPGTKNLSGTAAHTMMDNLIGQGASRNWAVFYYTSGSDPRQLTSCDTGRYGVRFVYVPNNSSLALWNCSFDYFADSGLVSENFSGCDNALGD